MTQASDIEQISPDPEGQQPAGQEAAPHPAQDPTQKTEETSDPTADDPGNGAD